jgi:hypothetical protein
MGSGMSNVIIAVAIFLDPGLCASGARQYAGAEAADLY